MNHLSLLKPALSEALSVILPTAEETLVLRACLLSRNSACQAWEEWRIRKNDLRKSFISDDESIKKIRPLVFNALRSHGLEVDQQSQTYLRSAYLKEELRRDIFRRICRDVLLSLASADIPTIILKGAALAETVYDHPALRHCHDIDLLIKDQDIDRAKRLLPSIGFKEIDQKDQLTDGTYKFEHESGLPLELHTDLFQLPYYNGLRKEMWERSQNQIIADCRARTLAPADNLLHVCGHAFHQSRRQSLRWAGDAWFLIARHRDLDWDLVLDCANRSRLTLPLSVTLAYLAEELNAPIPRSFLDRLFNAASRSSAMERDLALFAAHSAPHGRLMNLFRKMKTWRGRADMLRWLLVPSPGYLFMVEEARPSWPLPVHYVHRLLRYARCILYNSVGVIRLIKWRVEEVFLRTNLRTP